MMNAVYIEITDTCNLSCSFCPCGKGEKNKVRSFMDTALFERSLEQAATVTSNVYFHVLGEPTLHPGFGLFLKKLEPKNLKLNLTTNGTTISRTGKSILATAAIRQVNISTHAFAELPLELAASHLQNVLDFCKWALVERPDLYINLRLWNVGDKSSDSWNQYMLSQIEQSFSESSSQDNGLKISLEHFCSRHKSFNIKGRLYLHQDSRFEWPSTSNKNKPTLDSKPVAGSCRALDTHCAILHDGRVVACCLDHGGQITLGNIQNQALSEILDSPTAQNIKEGFAKHQLRHPFCQSCTFCKRFK